MLHGDGGLCVCVFCWKTADLVCLTRLNAALDEWHSETGIRKSLCDAYF